MCPMSKRIVDNLIYLYKTTKWWTLNWQIIIQLKIDDVSAIDSFINAHNNINTIWVEHQTIAILHSLIM